VTLKFTPENIPPPGQAPPGVSGARSEWAIDLHGADRSSFGLKLESQRAPVNVLVVDGADRPTEN
jgi:uncharacterized protein (TIGR03435 family)